MPEADGAEAAHHIQLGHRLPSAVEGDTDSPAGKDRSVSQRSGRAWRPAHVLSGADHRAEKGRDNGPSLD